MSEKALSLSLSLSPSVPWRSIGDRIGALDAGHVLACLVAAAATSEEMYVTRESRYTRLEEIGAIDRWTRELFKRNRLVGHTLVVLEEEKGKGRRQVTGRQQGSALERFPPGSIGRARDRMTSDDLAPREPRRA